MTTLRKFWLLLSLLLPQAISPAVGATLTLKNHCATNVVESDAPKTNRGMSLKLRRHEPFAPSFKKYLHEESNIRHRALEFERAAEALAYSASDDIQMFQSNDDTYVKFRPSTNELLVVANERILFYDRVNPNDGDWYNGLRIAKVRVNLSLGKVLPFQHYSLQQHFHDHGHEFETTDPAEYEKRAIAFAESDSPETLTLEVNKDGNRRWVRANLATRELVVVGQDTHQVISYYRLSKHRFRNFLGSVKIKPSNYAHP